MLLKKFAELSARVCALETQNTGLREENIRLQTENRQKLDQFIRHYFGGQHNEGLDKHQLKLLLQGSPSGITVPTPEAKPAAAGRPGTSHPVHPELANVAR
jgi:hypothetical protein